MRLNLGVPQSNSERWMFQPATGRGMRLNVESFDNRRMAAFQPATGRGMRLNVVRGVLYAISLGFNPLPEGACG